MWCTNVCSLPRYAFLPHILSIAQETLKIHPADLGGLEPTILHRFASFKLITQLTRVGETTGDELREHQLLAHNYIEDTTPVRDQGRFDSQGLPQFIRHTDGFRFVVSLGAIVNLSVHDPLDMTLWNLDPARSEREY